MNVNLRLWGDYVRLQPQDGYNTNLSEPVTEERTNSRIGDHPPDSYSMGSKLNLSEQLNVGANDYVNHDKKNKKRQKKGQEKELDLPIIIETVHGKGAFSGATNPIDSDRKRFLKELNII